MALYHEGRTAQWGHWGITFMNPQPDPTRNYGEIVGTLYFPVGTRGPCDGFLGSAERTRYADAVRDWIENGVLPKGVRLFEEERAAFHREYEAARIQQVGSMGLAAADGWKRPWNVADAFPGE